MNNEIGRKITSLTLMTIMIAGGMTFAMPGVMPAAHAQANANLFVSVEESVISDRFGGPMVVEVIINDPDLKEIDEAESEPNVQVNGAKLRMAQADDGNWYAYFADRLQALAADATPVVAGTSLDFGFGCTVATASLVDGIDYSGTRGVMFSLLPGGAPGPAGALGACAAGAGGADTQNVIRENRTLNDNAAVAVGQLGYANWPAIQLYDFTAGGNAVIKYNIGGGSPQTVSLEFDDALDDHPTSGISTDRSNGQYPRGAAVHLTINDVIMNIDPTDEDTWTFGTNTTNSTAGTAYNVFNEDGLVSANLDTGPVDQIPDVAITNLRGPIQSGTFNNGDLLQLKINVDKDNSKTFVLNSRDNANTGILFDNTGAANDAHIPGTASTILGGASFPLTFTETESSSGIFENTDEADLSNLFVTENAKRGTTATVDYNDSASSIRVTFFFGTIDMDASVLGGEWNSGEEIPVTLVDQDLNLNTRVDEDIDLSDASFPLVPSLQIGSPITLAGLGSAAGNVVVADSVPDLDANVTGHSVTVQAFSQRANLGFASDVSVAAGDGIEFTTGVPVSTLTSFVANGTTQSKYSYLNYDVRTFSGLLAGPLVFTLGDNNGPASTATGNSNGNQINATNNGVNSAPVAPEFAAAGTTEFQGLIDLTNVDLATDLLQTGPLAVGINFTGGGNIVAGNYTVVVDFFNFGQSGDGEKPSERFNNAIYRLELEESGDNTGTFVGSVEYIMLNQINVNQTSTYLGGIDSISDAIEIIVHEDLTDEDAPRINYLDLGADGVSTQIADQQEAPTHSGVVSFDSSTYKIADTVTITLEDKDLNVDTETIDIFTVVSTNIVGAPDDAFDQVGASDYGQNTAGENFGRILDVTFDDELWRSGLGVNGGFCGAAAGTPDDGLGSTGFTLGETGKNTGVFTGDFQIPDSYCQAATGLLQSVTGTDVEVNYVDYRDASGEIIEVGDGAGIRANTGSVSLDRTVYPVPWGNLADTKGLAASGDSIFRVHATGITGAADADTVGEILSGGDLTVHIRVNDPDFDISASGEDKIATLTDTDKDGTVLDEVAGPVKISVSRGSSKHILSTAGGPAAFDGKITVTTTTPGIVQVPGIPPVPVAPFTNTPEAGPITEIAPDAGIFELDFTIRYTDGPTSATCPPTASYEGLNGTARGSAAVRFFDPAAVALGKPCILQGDILTVEYTDPTDASGDPNTVTDSATFDLRNGVLQSDKSVYIIGSDMILTVIEPDWDLDNDGAETYDLDTIEWDSDAATTTMGNLGIEPGKFDPEPSALRETGDSTGIFQVVIEIPDSLDGDKLERGEEVVLEYTDWGPSGADFVGDEDEDVNLTIFTSNFGATVELDQKVYTWTDKVYITIVAPDHNFDSNLIDEIGDTKTDPIKVATRGSDIDNYKLVETGTDTGIFTGEVILTGFGGHDADGDGTPDIPVPPPISPDFSGPTDGLLPADDDDGITVSFEFSEDETVVGSALIRWNIGEVQWLEASYPATGTGVVRIVDPDLNLNPEAVDNFDVDVWSDSDAGGIDLTVTETNEATGIFEGTVFFTITDESSGHRLRVSEGDTITAEYEDNTLPDPYTTADELDITGTAIIGTIVPPLERAPASGLRVVDAFGNSLGQVSVDQQVQITSDLANGQDRDQAFAYLVQVQDSNGVTVSLAWITGSLTAGQSFSPALSWIPTDSGTYTATAFVWESVDNPTALSPPVKTTVTVN